MAENLKERAYSHLYAKLVGGEYVPGSRLSSRALATEMGMSIIPIREAVSQLQSEGFVEYRPGVGSFVPTPSIEELHEIYELRELIEANAAGKAAQVATESDLAELKGIVEEGQSLVNQLEKQQKRQANNELFVSWSKMDARFHDTIMAAAANRRAAELIHRLRTMSRIFGKRAAQQPVKKFQQTQASHKRILKALESSDSEAAARAMSDHIRGAWQSLLELQRGNRFLA